MLAMQQSQAPSSLEAGPRRLKKGDGKDKLKHRLSMVFKNSFSLSSKFKPSDSVASTAPRPGPQPGPAPVVRCKSSAHALAASTSTEQSHNRDEARRRRPSAEPVTRHRLPGPINIGSSPPLPPLPEKTPALNGDTPGVNASQADHSSSRVEPLLPSYSSRPGSQASAKGLGIGVELPSSSAPPETTRTSQRTTTSSPSPPPLQVQRLEGRLHETQNPSSATPSQPQILSHDAAAVKAVERLESQPTRRDRIALLREGRSSVSAEAGSNPHGASSRGINRSDPTKSYTIGTVPPEFDVALAAAPRAPLKPLQLASRRSSLGLDSDRRSSVAHDYSRRSSVTPDQSRRSSLAHEQSRRSSLGVERTFVGASTTSKATPRRPSDGYCRRPTVTRSTQTPREWPAPGTHVQTGPVPRRPSWIYAVSTPPQPFGAFPAPPPVPPHDTPQQKHGISPSIYSVASFDPRPTNSAPLRHWPAAIEPATVNYDVPYLSPLADDDEFSTVGRQLDELATPVLLGDDAVERSRLAAALPSVKETDRTPTLESPAPGFAGFLPPTYGTAGADVLIEASHRSRTPSPVPALSHGHSSSDEAGTVSVHTRRASSTLSSPRRSTSSEVLLTPPASAVSSAFPELISHKDSDGEDEAAVDEAAIVTIRKASLVTSDLRKAALVSTPSSRPVSIALRAELPGSVASLYEHRSGTAVNASKSRQNLVDGTASTPLSAAAEAPGSSMVADAALSDVSPGLEHPRARPVAAIRDAHSSSASRRYSEPFAALSAGPRPRAPGTVMSGADRASRSRSFFLVQALMGESQPEGMVRDWAQDEDSDSEGSDGDVSLPGGVQSDFDDDDEE